MKSLITWILIIVVLVGGWYLYKRNESPTPLPNTTDNTGTNSTDNGNSSSTPSTVTRSVGSPATANDIVVTTPKQGDSIISPITVTGKARGTWYFEASAPVVIIDTTGATLGQGTIQAQSDWMTTDFVPFKGTINFTHATGTVAGALVFLNDNPSGQASTSKYLVVPIFFK
ncbi:Gmad2 immunoglobulin-like domain-containing protein [Candidatus Parcubacteria bacterium]|nr:Gmad2 immunoglobulin-like domain-containing protein [Candidatus Parcubacteria bacterium]